MDGVLAAGRTAFLTLLAFQIFLLIPRFFTSGRKKDFILFIAVLVVLGIKTFFSQVYVVGVSTSLILIYVTGNLLYSLAGEKYDFLWNICIGSVSAILVLIILLRLTDNFFFPLFYTVIMIIAFTYPFAVIIKLYRIFKSPVLLYLIYAASALILARAWDLISGLAGLPFIDMTLWASIALTLGLGYLAFNEGHIIGIPDNSQSKPDPNTGSVFARLTNTENTLLLQDRVIASGMLAIGAIHEFKNIITNIKAVSQFGLSSDSIEKKNQSLEAALENANEAQEVVRKYLDTASLELEEKRKSVDLGNDLRPFFQILESHFHKQRITFSVEIDEGIRLAITKGEIEQIIQNLVRNSADSLREIKEGQRTINLTAKREDNNAIIDICDNGVGVPENAETKIMSTSFSGKGSSGIGLMLVRLIVMRNNGIIEYHPRDVGAQFRVILPCAEEEESWDEENDWENPEV
jgi:signal transduction histidine kinase